MPRLSLADRNQAIGMLQAGMSRGEVAAHFQCHRSTISALVRRQRERNDVTDRPRSGRPCVTTARQDRWIQVTHLRNRCLTAADTAGVIPGNRCIHPMTIRRRLREIGLRPCRPAIQPILTQRHRQVRLQWRFVMFTDESRFQLSRSDGRIRVYRRRN
jgi:transposase